MPETQPTPWELMRILRDIRDDLRDVKRNSITRDEWNLAQQSTDRRFSEAAERMGEWRDTSVAEHVALDAKISAVRKEVDAVKGEASKRRFSLALSAFGASLSLIVGIALFVIQRGIG